MRRDIDRRQSPKEFVFLWMAVLLFAISPFPAYPNETSADDEIGRLYVRHGIDAYLNNRREEASKIASIALQFSPANPDALFLTGLLAADSGNSVYDSLIPWISALSGTGFSVFDELECREATAALLCRIGFFQDALTILSHLPGTALLSEQTVLMKANALVRTGKTLEAAALLRNAIPLFPSSVPIIAMLIRIDPVYLETFIRWKAEARPGLVKGPEIDLAIVSSITDTEQKGILIESLGGPDTNGAEYYIEFLKTLPEITYTDIDHYLAFPDSMRKEALIHLHEVLNDEQLRGYLAWKLRSFTGIITLDENHDGIWEEYLTFLDGKVTEILVDRNQDGLAEYQGVLDAGKPLESLFRFGGSVYQVFYDTYPAVIRGVIYTPDSMTIYHFPKGKFRYPIGNPTDSLFISRFQPVISPEPSLQLFSAQANQAERYDRNSPQYPVERWERLLSGFSKTESGLRNDGSYTVERIDLDGLPVVEKRDTDADGVFDVFEITGKQGEVSRAFDGNGNGIPEYSETLGNGTVLKLWDFNEDWIPDCSSYSFGDGYTTIAYSRGQTGSLDTELRYRNGLLEEIVRNGKEIQVFKVNGEDVFWINSPPPKGIVIPAGYTGPFTRNGRSFFVVSVGTAKYVEELE